MCGRYTITENLANLGEYAKYTAPGTEFGPHYNISPGQFAPVIVLEDGQRTIRLMRWGLVPFWAKDETIAYKTINARSETLTERASFKNALKKRRCLVLADGFYEWEKKPGGKQPHYIYLKDHRPFCFAGLWEKWDRGEEPDPLYTFTIVTTSPNEKIRRLHNRMPVILPREQEDTWLDLETPPDELEGLYEPYDPAAMDLHPVAKEVGNTRNNHEGLVDPV